MQGFDLFNSIAYDYYRKTMSDYGVEGARQGYN